jgi:hypothetical protein
MTVSKMKRGQMKLSFGMIFSIILIIVFLSFAIYAIMKILDFQKKTSVGIFVNDLQDDVDEMWQSAKGSQTNDYDIPGNILRICFFEDSSIEFDPLSSAQGFNGREIEHAQIPEKFCLESSKGRVGIKISKDFGEDLVTLSEI